MGSYAAVTYDSMNSLKPQQAMKQGSAFAIDKEANYYQSFM